MQDKPDDDTPRRRTPRDRETAADGRRAGVDAAEFTDWLMMSYLRAGTDIRSVKDTDLHTEARRREKEEGIERRERTERNSKRLWFIFNAAAASGCAYAVSRIGNIVEWMRDFLHR